MFDEEFSCFNVFDSRLVNKDSGSTKNEVPKK